MSSSGRVGGIALALALAVASTRGAALAQDGAAGAAVESVPAPLAPETVEVPATDVRTLSEASPEAAPPAAEPAPTVAADATPAEPAPPAASAAPATPVPSPAQPRERRLVPMRLGTTVAFEFLRISSPTPFGLSFRYLILPFVSIDAQFTTAVGIRDMGYGASVYPLMLLRGIPVTPFGYLGFERFVINDRIDEGLGRVGVDVSDVPEIQLNFGNTALLGLEWRAGVHARTRAGFFVELAYGEFHQFGESHGRTEQDGVVFTNMRFRIVSLGAGMLLDFRRRH